jgi:hypothetical protein
MKEISAKEIITKKKIIPIEPSQCRYLRPHMDIIDREMP